MKKITWTFTVVAMALLLQCYAEMAWAQNSNGGYYRTWISPTGSDNGGCQASAPCASFAEAISQTIVGGEVSCLGGGESFGDNIIGGNGANTTNGVTITGTITIDCHGTSATHMPVQNINGFYINAHNAVVTLRGLNINGAKGVPFSAADGANGVVMVAAAVVIIEDCVIENFAQRGIYDQRTGGGTTLSIKNTVVRNNGGAGIVAAASATNSVMLENVQSVGNNYGLAVATGNHVVVSHSAMFGNAAAGIEADPGGQVYVDYAEITNNGIGIQSNGNIALGNSGIVSNSTGITGTTTSYGNNRIFANSTAGATPTPISGASTDYGQK